MTDGCRWTSWWLLLAAALAACAAEPPAASGPPSPSAPSPSAEPVSPSSTALSSRSPSPPAAAGQRPFCRLFDVRALDVGRPAMAPRFSDRGDRLLFTGPKYRGLFVVPAVGGAVEVLSEDEPLGYRAWWERGDVLAVDMDGAGQRFGPGGIRRNDVRAGGIGAETARSADGRVFFQRDDDIWSRSAGGEEARETDGSDRFFAPSVSPDGSWLSWKGLVTGIHLRHLASGGDVAAGRGNHVAWWPDSRRILFDVSTDDGTRILVARLVAYDLESRERVDVEAAPGSPEVMMHASVAPDGRRVAFDSVLGIYVAGMECGQ